MAIALNHPRISATKSLIDTTPCGMTNRLSEYRGVKVTEFLRHVAQSDPTTRRGSLARPLTA